MTDKKTEALKLALVKIRAAQMCHPNAVMVLIDEAEEVLAEALAEQPAPPAKLKVTLEDRPIDTELAQYKRMFEAACSALGQIGDALGCDPEEGGEEPILAAIAELKAEQPAQPQQVPVAWAKKAMELASDLSIESLRLGSYERKDTYEHSGRASWQTVEIRQKREDARERLRQHLYTSPPAQRKPIKPTPDTEFSAEQRLLFKYGWKSAEAAHGIGSES